MSITRGDAIRVILDCVLKANDEVLEEILYDLVGGENPNVNYPGICLNNFTIVSGYDSPWCTTRKFRPDEED